jgi:hypothetical protein
MIIRYSHKDSCDNIIRSHQKGPRVRALDKNTGVMMRTVRLYSHKGVGNLPKTLQGRAYVSFHWRKLLSQADGTQVVDHPVHEKG